MEKVISEMAFLLSSGGIISLPTDTLYGLACSINSDYAIRRLYDIKGRNVQKPIAICVAEIEDMSK